MSTLMVIGKDGVAISVYDDKWQVLHEALGTPKVTRASELEFDHDKREWSATLIGTDQVIAQGRSRTQTNQEEVQWLEQHVVKAR